MVPIRSHTTFGLMLKNRNKEYIIFLKQVKSELMEDLWQHKQLVHIADC